MSRQQFVYLAIRATLDHRPTRVEMYQRLQSGFSKFTKEGWLRYLAKEEELTGIEQTWLDTPAEEFLRELEITAFQKAYKIPTILAFLTLDGVRKNVTLHDIAKSFMDFYYSDPIHQTDFCDKSNQDWRNWDIDKFADLALIDPVYYLSNNRFFHYDENTQVFELDSSIHPYLSCQLAGHIRDIMEYRRLRHFAKQYKNYSITNAESAVSQVAEDTGTKADIQDVIVFNKLIRDRIPEIIAAQGKKCETRVLDEVEYHIELERKLQEEMEEYLASGAVEELADLMEVILAIAKENGFSQENLERLRLEKLEKRGGFEGRVLLKRVF